MVAVLATQVGAHTLCTPRKRALPAAVAHATDSLVGTSRHVVAITQDERLSLLANSTLHVLNGDAEAS